MIKKITALLFGITALTSLYGQVEHPVKWAYGTKKLSTNTYEVHLKATLKNGWHLYSQKQPENSVSTPTSFKFKTVNGLTLVGKVKEIGKPIDFEDANSGLGAKEYANTVDFVQIIKVKNGSTSSVSGTINFQVCTDHKCLQPDSINFIVPIK